MHTQTHTSYKFTHTDQYPRPHITPPNFQPVYHSWRHNL